MDASGHDPNKPVYLRALKAEKSRVPRRTKKRFFADVKLELFDRQFLYRRVYRGGPPNDEWTHLCSHIRVEFLGLKVRVWWMNQDLEK